MPEKPIATVGEVREVISDRLCRVKLKNGKEVLGFLGKAAVAEQIDLEVGAKVELEMTPFDFSKGRIVRLSREPECERG